MFVDEWDAFYQQAEALFLAEPLKTRLVLKYTHSKAKLVLKVTDDRTVRWLLSPYLLACVHTKSGSVLVADAANMAQVVQYRTDQISDLRKVEQLNNRFFALTARGPDATGKSQQL